MFSVYLGMRKHSHCLIPVHFPHPKKMTPYPLAVAPHPPLFGNHKPTFCLLGLDCCKHSHTWNPTIRGVGPASVTSVLFSGSVHVVAPAGIYAFPWPNIPWYRRTTLTWVISALWPPWTVAHRGSCGCRLPLLRGTGRAGLSNRV